MHDIKEVPLIMIADPCLLYLIIYSRDDNMYIYIYIIIAYVLKYTNLPLITISFAYLE